MRVIHNALWRISEWIDQLIISINVKFTIYVKTGKVALCCIVKCENDYVREWLDYYFSLGIDKIFIYDNNDFEGEHLEEVISDYLNNNKVEVLNFRGRKKCQLEAYQDCYDRYKNDFDWICFFDCDEFLTLTYHNDIHAFLNLPCFEKYQIVHINWMCYGDNDLVDNDGRPVLERFTNPLPFDFFDIENFPENYLQKSIVRGGLRGLRWNKDSHSPNAYYLGCTSTGEKTQFYSSVHQYDYSSAYLRHYYTKTVGEWIRVKMKRGYPDQCDNSIESKLNLHRFFVINQETQSKLDYAYSILKKSK